MLGYKANNRIHLTTKSVMFFAMQKNTPLFVASDAGVSAEPLARGSALTARSALANNPLEQIFPDSVSAFPGRPKVRLNLLNSCRVSF